MKTMLTKKLEVYCFPSADCLQTQSIVNFCTGAKDLSDLSANLFALLSLACQIISDVNIPVVVQPGSLLQSTSV